MRNLSLISLNAISLPNARISHAAIDLDQNILYVAIEKQSSSDGDEDVVVEIYRVDEGAPHSQPQLVTMFPATSSQQHPQSQFQSRTQLIALRVVQETKSLVAIMRNGEILSGSLEDEFDMPMMEVQGSVDDGLIAASWSPDDSLLALVTGANKLILMTLTFDVISESPLETSEFGQDTPISVGWGSKQTQFHGSLGKAAAQASTSSIPVGSSPDEDWLPRISWRGDGAFFVVSFVSTIPSSSSSTSTTNGTSNSHATQTSDATPTPSSLPHRVLRVYDHQAILQSTSESVPGLEHVLSWRPSGNLIASTQRFGLSFKGGGAGREGKHDVVFFERNGLRHGEFELREEGSGSKAGTVENGLKLRWGYRVKEVLWSPDSNVLAVWIERDTAEGGGDVVQLWTTGNYHWYLKQEISALDSNPGGAKFTSVEWYPEKELKLILTTTSQVILRTYTWETITSPSSMPPADSGSVGVIDGSTILLTPFRTQNIPPPMSSVQLKLEAGERAGPALVRVPIHSTFLNGASSDLSSFSPTFAIATFTSADSELLALLWEHGYVELYDLHTRLGPGRGKVMDPVKVGGFDFGNGSDDRQGGVGYRQVVMLASPSVSDTTNGEGEEQLTRKVVTILVLGSSSGSKAEEEEVDTVVILDLESNPRQTSEEAGRFVKTGKGTIAMPFKNGRLVKPADAHAHPRGSHAIWQGPDGGLFALDIPSRTVSPFGGDFLEYCDTTLYQRVRRTGQALRRSEEEVEVTGGIENEEMDVCVGLTRAGKLIVCCGNGSPTSGGQGQARVLSTTATSFTIGSGYLIYTTAGANVHEAVFAPLVDLLPNPIQTSTGFGGSGEGGEEGESEWKSKLNGWEKRRVERGSKIVVCVPSEMRLVLQMPRGNLETVYPRPLVLEVVRRDLDCGEYRKAFFTCRKHRIDLNFLVRHDEDAFLEGIGNGKFVEQVCEVDHLNLFLTSLGQGLTPLPSETIAKISDALREQLENKDLKTYVNSILTAHVIKSPPNYESALALLLRLKGAEPALVEDAVKYIIFLVDANKLFDTALGMYDFELVLMVAQHAQKDPREYLPFLRELRAVKDKSYQRFRIDDHLKRYSSALRNLAQAGPDYFDEAIRYVERYSLYDVALEIWKETDRFEDVLVVYGDWLFERREFRQAAAVFVEAKRPQKAMVAYEKALEWQELFELALRYGEFVSEEELEAMAYRVSEDLVSKKRFAEAARVVLDYTTDVRTAVIMLVQGNEFSEALRVTTLKRKPELVEDIIHPGALESKAQIDEDLNEMREQLRKQLNRIRELRVKKVEEPDEFYGVEDTALHNVDVMTDVSMAPTAFTRYTVAPSTASRTSKRSSRSKRKMERKVGSGRKGTVDEEEYLLKSVGKLVVRFSATRGEGKRLLPHLLKFTANHREEGQVMQRELEEFEKELRDAVDEIWAATAGTGGVSGETDNMSNGDGQTQIETAALPPLPQSAQLQDSWAARMEEAERLRRINPVERVAKPQVDGNGDGDWKMRLFEVGRVD
ncbi:hypothetical protein GYMLUDRAFT_244010 [Collybiopsis luxurians FD-317 M1]|uniref:Elongator complex protein 1 n=1 Tax=Collybiopsis luxurians FD-317 M1 TaxID=944289 RepID=A0A0D0CPP3_9AGAR|nr:hypothetical protein GYMLUDRAFT_244010 [Collybiopsis luxurians FD-317 M1]